MSARRIGAAALAAMLACSLGGLASAKPSVGAREGWAVHETEYRFEALVKRVTGAVKSENMLRVYMASASRAAKGRGIAIPGNAVIGVYRNDYAVRMLDASVAAGMEAPIVLYVTEDEDGGATLSYKRPSFAFAPYMEEGGEKLRVLAAELDAVFAKIAQRAIAE